MRSKDLHNIKILCDFIEGKLDETAAFSHLILKQKTEKAQKKYIKNLLLIIKEEQSKWNQRRQYERTIQTLF